MRRVSLFLMFLVVYFAFRPSLADTTIPEGYEVIPGSPAAPQEILVGEGGGIRSLSEFFGKTVILNFWATWCIPCVTEMPSLNRLAKALPANRFVVVTVNEDAGGVVAGKPFLDRLGVTNVVILADPDGRLKRALGARGLPTTFVFLPNGSVHGKIEGPAEWDSDRLKNFLLSIP